MKLPSHIRIKAKVRYQLVWVDRFDDSDTLALCIYDDKQIQFHLSLKEKPHELAKALIHEVLHAVAWEYGLKIPHSLIYALDQVLFRILKLNGWI